MTHSACWYAAGVKGGLDRGWGRDDHDGDKAKTSATAPIGSLALLRRAGAPREKAAAWKAALQNEPRTGMPP
jgi:hypothetical protein